MKWIPRVGAVCAVSILSGCMSIPIEGDCPKTPDSKYGRETVHGSYYGSNWDDGTRRVCKANNGLGWPRLSIAAISSMRW